jgi:putative adhesin
MRRRFTLGLIAMSLVAVQPALAAIATKTVEQTIPASGHVKIANLAGRVVLVPAGNGPVKVVAVVNAEGSSPQETQDLMQAMRWVQEHDGTWNLAYPVDRYDAFVFPDRLMSMGSHSASKFRGRRVHVYGGARRGVPVLYADLTITVPKGADLKVVEVVGGIRGDNLSADLYLDTGSGDIKLDGAAGELVADTGSGDIELHRIAGNTRADTGSGDVTIDGIAADKLTIDTGSGDVKVSDATVGDLFADTGSGGVTVDGSRVQTFRADTGSGDVKLAGDLSSARSIDVDTGSGEVEILGGPAFEFDLMTDVGSGDVDVRYDDAELRHHRREVIGARRGSGQTRVMVDTGSGDVTVAPGAGR